MICSELKEPLFNQVFVQRDNAGFAVLHGPGVRRNEERMRPITLNYVAAP
jgi:hypothetical protein